MASSCVLRVTGDNFIPSDFLRDSIFEPCLVFRKGERRTASSVWDTSGITVDISSEDNFSAQVRDATVFLENNRVELLRLKQFTGFEELSLDFGVNGKGSFLQSYFFPLELIHLANEFAIELELSIYATE
jgi:hypothetical protein